MKKFQLILFGLIIISIVQVNSFILFKVASFGRAGSASNSISTPTRAPTSAPSSGVQYDFSGVPQRILRRKIEFQNNILNAVAQYKIGLALEGVRVLVSATSAAPDTSISDATSTTTPSPSYTYQKGVSIRRYRY